MRQFIPQKMPDVLAFVFMADHNNFMSNRFPYNVRPQFPALNREVNGSLPVFFDGPGGTQVPQCVLDAMVDYFGHYNSNLLDSPFFAVEKTHEVLAEARQKAAIFVNGQPDEIVFGATITSLTSQISRSIARDWQEGDEIIVTNLDHFANVSFWEMAAADKGVKAHRVHIDRETFNLDYDHLESLISPKTKLVAFTYASNICGSQVDAMRVIRAAKSVGALTYVDAVHGAVHFLPDVQALNCDFLACSSYKFFGPHLGILWGRKNLWDDMTAYKVEAASNISPEKWETGTKSFEALAGFNAAIDYLSSHQEINGLRDKIEVNYEHMFAYEQEWSAAFIERCKGLKHIKIYGALDPAMRSPTFALRIDGHHPLHVSHHLAHHNISAGAGNFYAKGFTETFGLEDKGGLLRVGCVHYNTVEEMDRLFEALEDL